MSTEENEDQVQHVLPFAHNGDVDDIGDLKKFYHKFTELKNEENLPVSDFYVEPKLVALEVQLYYVSGVFQRAVTRGNGTAGKDITEYVAKINNLPQNIPTKISVVINGGVLILRNEFYAVNQLRENKHLPAYKTMMECINEVLAGDNLELVSEYNFRFYAWELIAMSYKSLIIPDQRDYLIAYHFTVPKGEECKNSDAIDRVINEIARNKTQLPFFINGVMIKQLEPKIKQALEDIEGPGKATCIWRFADNGLVRAIQSVTWETERSGKLLPILHIKPTILDGIMVRDIPLTNTKYLVDNKLTVGTKIRISRAGDNRPRIDEVVSSVGEVKLPKECDCCKHALNFDGLNLFCVNQDCQAVLEASLRYIICDLLHMHDFTDYNIADIVNSKTVVNLIDIFTPIDNHTESVTQEQLDRFVSRARDCNLVDVITMLGIPSMGKAISGKIAIEVESIQGLMNLLEDKEELEYLMINDTVKKELVSWYAIPEHRAFLKQLQTLQLTCCP